MDSRGELVKLEANPKGSVDNAEAAEIKDPIESDTRVFGVDSPNRPNGLEYKDPIEN